MPGKTVVHYSHHWSRLGLLLALGLAFAAAGAEGAKPINTICPVSGRAVDPSVPPVIITMGKGERATKVVIGVADAAAAARVKANPELFVNAAKANKQAEPR
jgi:hypothetical protein